MSLTSAQIDGLMDVHDIVGVPDGPTVGRALTRPSYEQAFADLAGDSVETLHRCYGNNCLTDESLWIGNAVGNPLGIPGNRRPLRFRILHVMEFDDSGLIIRENVWLDQNAIVSQLANGQVTRTHQKEAEQ
jgi:hypothetical protein